MFTFGFGARINEMNNALINVVAIYYDFSSTLVLEFAKETGLWCTTDKYCNHKGKTYKFNNP